MKIDINHPSFLNFIDNVISNITTNVHIDKYFNLTYEQRLAEQLKVFKVMGSSLRNGVKLSELEYRSFVTVVLKKSEENEKYELSAILKDISENFSGLYEVTKPIKKPTTRKIKTNNKSE
jgi:hypothetical protein